MPLPDSTANQIGAAGHFTLRLADAQLHGEVRGRDPRAIFVHGFGGDLHGWDGIWDHLDGSLDAIRYDLRGFGQSRAFADTPFSHSEDLLALLNAAGIERAACLPDVDRLPNLRAPTLLRTGAHDLPDYRLIADLIAGSAGNVTRTDFPDGGHLLTLEAPEACSAAIIRFLGAA